VPDGFWLRRYILYKPLPRATAKKLNEKASLYEGHGFSRAVNRRCLTASAAEVRFCETHRFAVSLEVLRHPLGVPYGTQSHDGRVSRRHRRPMLLRPR
jgi:hypothetical protein